MKIIDLFKKKEKPMVTMPVLQRSTINQAIDSHRRRISNLQEEVDDLSVTLRTISIDIAMPRSKKEKSSDTIIKRMAILKYEIGVREDLIKWLS